MSGLSPARAPLWVFVVGLAVFGAVAGARLGHQSSDPHFVYQADAWLHGKLAIDPPPKKGDDWAVLETVELDDGSTARGRRLVTRPAFRVAGDGEIPSTRIRRRAGRTYYVSFPPSPALFMLPSALIAGRRGNDVVPTVLLAALALSLMTVALARLRDEGLSQRSPTDDLWLVAAFGFGTVFFFCSVQGRVWFTAHVVGVAATWGYLACSIRARRPLLAGLLLAVGALARVPLAFAFPIFLFEAWHAAGGDRQRFLARAALFAAPVAIAAALAMAFNQARWGAPLDFGHAYLQVRQQSNMETFGLFSPHYLVRNLEVAFALLPTLSTHYPYVQISGHGLAIWITTPLVFWTLWPRTRTRLHAPLWIALAVMVALPLFYQNSGWFQFGYRFGVDWLPYAFVLIAVGGLPLRRLARAAIVAGIVINLFGAVTFARYYQFYRTDAATYQSLS